MADLLLGVDGGGSKTRALLADLTGTVLGVGSAGSSNYQSVGFDAATAALQHSITAAYQQVAPREGAHTVVAACLGLAGVDRATDRALFEVWARQQAIAGRVMFVNDAELLLAGGTNAGWGIALICGTGSICYGRAEDGRTERSGGWGHLIGDEGSGYDIAVRGLRLATQTADGRATADALLKAILGHWQLDQPTQLIAYVYHPERTRAEIAALAPCIAALASDGDAAAKRIMAGAARHLGQLVSAVGRKLELVQAPVAFGGGLIGALPDLQRAVLDHAGVVVGSARYVEEPAQGALVLAKRMLFEYR